MSSRLFEVPLSGQNQTVAIALLGVTYKLTLQWRNAAQTWFLDIADASGNPLLQGVSLVQGANLLHQHQEIGIAAGLFMVCDQGIAAPTFDNLGSSAHLLFYLP